MCPFWAILQLVHPFSYLFLEAKGCCQFVPGEDLKEMSSERFQEVPPIQPAINIVPCAEHITCEELVTFPNVIRVQQKGWTD